MFNVLALLLKPSSKSNLLGVCLLKEIIKQKLFGLFYLMIILLTSYLHFHAGFSQQGIPSGTKTSFHVLFDSSLSASYFSSHTCLASIHISSLYTNPWCLSHPIVACHCYVKFCYLAYMDIFQSLEVCYWSGWMSHFPKSIISHTTIMTVILVE